MKVISTMAVVQKPLVATTDSGSTKAISTDGHSTKNYDLQLHSFYAVFTFFPAYNDVIPTT